MKRVGTSPAAISKSLAAPGPEGSASSSLEELNERIGRLESALTAALRPLEAMGDLGQRYLRLASMLVEHGGLSPDTLFPEVRDPISRDILSALMRLREANISRLTDELRTRRGKASRRIVRARLAGLERQGFVETGTRGRRAVYLLTERVVRKWSSIFVPEK